MCKFKPKMFPREVKNRKIIPQNYSKNETLLAISIARMHDTNAWKFCMSVIYRLILYAEKMFF